MNKFVYVIICILVLLGAVYFLKDKATDLGPELEPNEILLGHDSYGDNYIALAILEEGMKSVLGDIISIHDNQRTVVTKFNGFVERLEQSFLITSQGFSYTEFQAFGAADYNSRDYNWVYDKEKGKYELSPVL